MKINSLFYDVLKEDILKCTLCPHECVLHPNEKGFCGVRQNIGGEMFSLNYADTTSMGLDPMEKKPLYHFHPGEKILSLGTWGCNLKCPFCQNYDISQEKPSTLRRVFPKALPTILENYENVHGVAYTYSEPIVWFEFVLDSARAIKYSNPENYNVLVTNGYINEEALKLMLQYIDALNVDLKSFDDKIYRKYLKGSLEPVKRTIQLAVESNIHIEVTTSIVPTINDDLDMLEKEFTWLASLSKDIPLHLSRYHPAYKFDKPATSMSFLEQAFKLAKEYLNFVYLGNVRKPEYGSTYCPDCGVLLISRNGYNIDIKALNSKGECEHCGRKVVEV
ncbi:MAG TPA: AmmeMemoRadiSam system radical SAM enzyme [Defluviitoga sp.]|nr:AmmeMemoRadiSam system radical SAM enzyme [Defluviitoga sp.]HOP25043.1 AmmeMemoRadiSam system radical SAM enzyme [Defluviitoga sp.]HPZ29195.1 AmmeMemoRadiSam system radical SAM enzyme [Defluviitoga sp.]HQD63102.1 AmmeMemoRadiSam system radical SAM enzyme [Defluviitoga sp.]